MTSASLCVYADSLDPTQITDRLGLRPTQSFLRGDPITTHRRRYGGHPTGGWLLRSRDELQSEDLAAHVAWLLQRIMPAAESIRGLVADGFDVAIICVVSGRPGGGGPTVEPNALRDIAALGVPVDFDIYC